MEPRQEGQTRLGGDESMNASTKQADALDLVRLERWLTTEVEGYAGPLSVTRFSGGQSNPTYRLDTPNAAYVLRRKPMGQLLKGAHAVDREVRVLRAMTAAGVPVPRVRALCTDDAVIGSWFYVMDLVDGRIFWDGGLPGLSPAERHAHQIAMAQTIAAIHAVSPEASGLGDFGRHGGYVKRQVERWSRQYVEDEAAGRHPDLDYLVDWLPGNLPAESGVAVVHGDYRVDNVIFDPRQPVVAAVLDWELSTLGDPVADFAYSLMAYRVPATISWGLRGRDIEALGLPSEREYVAAYCRSAGRDDLPDLERHLAYNLFRLATIIHGIKGRVIRGTAASGDADAMVARLDLLAATAREVADASERAPRRV